MAPFQVGFIGCGRPRQTDGATGFGMAHAHAQGYTASPDCVITALADLNEENAKAFQETHGGERIYTDYHEMLKKEDLDIVSIATWPHLHADMVIACAEAGVRAVHCEKPMATTYGDSKRMVEACDKSGTQLTFNHQRRFGAPYRKARELLREGAVGELVRLEGTCSNLYDWGTHWFDMMFFYNEETPVEWVIGQIDTRNHSTVFGVDLEGHGISQFKFTNGVMGLLMTGVGGPGLTNKIIGTHGTIELGYSQDVPLRMWSKGQSDWAVIDVGEGLHGKGLGDLVQLGVIDLVESLKHGREPELSGHRVIKATELIFATYESSRRRARIDLPLDIDDSPMHTMAAAGEVVFA
ncbi:MAG: Gfo/Idh/MocA family oxidoreductase [Caldilineaceae bacterium]|nr:Gfo/Idh/MocA family oxidoreductase [Caldilineaceae bacterium]